MSDNSIAPEKPIYTLATDPIYIGTGGYTIGRVDNTIVRDPTTKIPKIPGSSLAGTWRYYVALELISKIKDFQPKFEEIKAEVIPNKDKPKLAEKIFSYKWKNLKNLKPENKKKFDELNNWLKFEGNQVAKITCAGQDNVPNAELDSPDATNKEGKTGHCGHCIVCKAFGYSKNKNSRQGMLFFSDLNILFFPVYTRLGVRWVTSPSLLEEISINASVANENIKTTNGDEKNLNLGWLNLKVEGKHELEEDKIPQEIRDVIKPEDIIIVPDSLIAQIINSNLEVRTSVSIDPITGAAKEGALFTSEAIPRGTVFYGSIRLFDKQKLGEENLPTSDQIWAALDDTKSYYETLGIGGMTTRGFGRMRILSNLTVNKNNTTANDSGGNGHE